MPTLSGDTQAVLATDKVRFHGQEVAFALADDRYSARDPAELRLENLIRAEQFPYRCKTGWVYDSGDYETALRKALCLVGYDELRREQARRREHGELIGIGVGFFTEAVGAGPRRHMDILGLG
jgi:aerobic carbon-monoxide dehydrogenase large subunit